MKKSALCCNRERIKSKEWYENETISAQYHYTAPLHKSQGGDTMKKAVIYARYSSDNQRSESIDEQVRACKYYAQHTGQYEIIGIYKDEALSGCPCHPYLTTA